MGSGILGLSFPWSQSGGLSVPGLSVPGLSVPGTSVPVTPGNNDLRTTPEGKSRLSFSQVGHTHAQQLPTKKKLVAETKKKKLDLTKQFVFCFCRN